MARSFDYSVVAPINVNFKRFPEVKERDYSSTRIFNRGGEVVAVQGEQHLYRRERPWFRRGSGVRVFDVDV